MEAKSWDNLKIGDRVITFNGPYHQDAIVTSKERDVKGMRWIGYKWIAPNRVTKFGMKRYMSVYWPAECT